MFGPELILYAVVGWLAYEIGKTKIVRKKPEPKDENNESK